MKANGTLPVIFHAVLISVLLSWCVRTAAAEPVAEQDLQSANADFAFNLLQQLAIELPASNIFISPYSASTVLQMVSTGAASTTLTEMESALCTTNLSLSTLDNGNKELGTLINAPNTNFILSTANAVWYQEGLPLRKSFINGDRRFFSAKVEGLDFGAPTAIKTINQWASKETHGKITDIVKKLPPGTAMVLANAVYFFGNWQNPFDTNLTANEPFYSTEADKVTVPMMQQTATFGYCAGEDFQAVRLPYRGNDLAMYVFLPAAGTSVNDLLGEMNGDWWQETINGSFMAQQGTLELPRFDLDFADSLVPALRGLGMETAFTPAADFSGISPDSLYISDVEQQAIVKVNELGTEAAAVTTVIVVTGVVSYPPPFQMIVNRPFLFFIEDEQAKMILFAGVVLDPSS
ncbi:MAG: serpin family protein [Limisphaerales bacterium]